ncbi:MAG: MFS transporter [Polyangiaceae bacterium]
MNVVPRFFDLRHGEARGALLGFAAQLLLIITGHTVLEAARDALILAGPGPRALGVVYMAIAICAWPAAAVAARAGERFGARRALRGTMAIAAAVAVALFLVPATATSAIVTYVVSGLIGSIAVPQFWTLVGKFLTVAQGRRLFGLIAAAGVIGGILGSGTAAAVLVVLPVKWLLLVAAVVFAVAWAALLGVGSGEERAHRPERVSAPTVAEMGHALRNQPLLSRIALNVVLSTATLLVLDYCFKSSLARSLPSAQIGPFVARYYFALNVLSLIVQVFLCSAVVRHLGVTAAIVLTPFLLLVGATGVVVFGGALGAVLLMKAIDGGLRFSIHRITGELIYMPVPLRIRLLFKPLIDGALVRASQTLTGASLLLLGGTSVLAPWPLASIVAGLASAWLASALTMRRPYVALLRRAISSGSLQAQDSPEPLDLESAQLLVQHLASEDPLEVVGAMNALTRRGHAGFVPALILLHSDELVLTQALDHFGASTRTDWMVLARRLLTDKREGVRMAAARALAAHDELDVERLADDVGARVRGYAVVVLALRDRAEDALEHERIAAQLHEAGATGESTRLGMLAAIADAAPNPALTRLLLALSDSPSQSPEHNELFARAAARQRDPRLVPRLVELLPAREGREAVRAALVAFGEDALQAVWWALRDTTRPHRFRIHAPKTLGRFGTKVAADHLLENIETEEDGLVRYKSIRALELLVAQRRVVLDRTRVERLARDALVRHFRLLAARVALGRPPLVEGRALAADRLLAGLLDDKLRQSQDRAFRLLAIAHPREDFRRVRIACQSNDPTMRANAGELLDALLRHHDEQPLRALFRLITEELSAADRAARAGPLIEQRLPGGRNEALAMLTRDRDPVLARLAGACGKGLLPSPTTAIPMHELETARA